MMAWPGLASRYSTKFRIRMTVMSKRIVTCEQATEKHYPKRPFEWRKVAYAKSVFPQAPNVTLGCACRRRGPEAPNSLVEFTGKP
jgi:hypothetical protein